MRVHVRAALVRIADNRDCFCGGLEDKGNLWPRRTKPLPLARRLWNSLAATVSEVADSLSGEIFLSAYNKRDRSRIPRIAGRPVRESLTRFERRRARRGSDPVLSAN